MAKKTISQALKDLFLGLGGNESALADNTSASDYIQDLESAIKATASGAVGDIIDDTEASDTTTYSSNKITNLIPEVQDTKYQRVSLSRAYGQNWNVSFPQSTDRQSFVSSISKDYPTALGLGMSFVDNLIFVGGTLAFLSHHTDSDNNFVIYHGIVKESPSGNLYEMYVRIDADSSKDAVYYKAFEFPTT